MPVRSYFDADISTFAEASDEQVLGVLALRHAHALDLDQKSAWLAQLAILRHQLSRLSTGHLFLEFTIPRMGKRADAVLIKDGIIFVLEFKVGADRFDAYAIEQVEDYALDLRSFHEGSYHFPIVPIVVATKAREVISQPVEWVDNVARPLRATASDLGQLILATVAEKRAASFSIAEWIAAGYRPTPTIIEAARVLYETHGVDDISRSDAGARNLKDTADCIGRIIEHSKRNRRKSICFVTGVPGAGKTLAGLNIATQRAEGHVDEHAVFLSGNGPLVAVLREALSRDQAARQGISKSAAERKVRSFVQNIHHFRDHYVGEAEVPVEKVTVFDEAQRAWTREQASKFMQQKRGHHGFDMSEPEFLISVMNRHNDWCTVVCLIGGGQEINTGEAGLPEWLEALGRSYANWDVYISQRVTDPDFSGAANAERFLALPHVSQQNALHLDVSMRSFRAEDVSAFVSRTLDNHPEQARIYAEKILSRYPIYVTRDLEPAKKWLRNTARGSERFGLVASSGAYRLRPEGIQMKSAIDPPVWFLNDRADVRSSYYLEEVASEFDVQGLELDWTVVCWDADYRYQGREWKHFAFKGTKWQAVNDAARRRYQRNAYRVILTRARQGMVIFVPRGDDNDPTRPPSFYDETFEYLQKCGIPLLQHRS
ncbi:DUF2075 domain-containing protein [Rhizobium sp. BR 362]|uniref:DUF2075 domain-containing protein n=1 Tax=Rhizobium sp. BR 362 TaxID=3040670 RepID=UPI002F41CE11